MSFRKKLGVPKSPLLVPSLEGEMGRWDTFVRHYVGKEVTHYGEKDTSLDLETGVSCTSDLLHNVQS